MRQACSHIVQIARLTFLEAVRQRFFNFVLVLMLALIGSASFFRKFDFGYSELRFIANFGMGGLEFFGAILAIVATAQLFFSEIENRTALTLLAKPVRRWSFIAGKLLGVMLLMLVFVAVLTLALGLYLWWREGQLVDRWHEAFLSKEADSEFPDTLKVQFGGLALDALIQWVKFNVLAAITMLVASYSNTNLFSVVISFFMYLICQLQYIAKDSVEQITVVPLQRLAKLLSLLFPNFQLFSVGDLLIFHAKVPVAYSAILEALGYGAVYVLVFLALAVYSFRNREI